MYIAAVLVVLTWLVVRWRIGCAPWPPPPRLTAPWLVPVCAAISSALFFVQLRTLAFEAVAQAGPPCFKTLPVTVVADFGPTIGGEALLLPGAILLACAVFQALLLTCIYIASRQRPPTIQEWAVTWLAVGCSVVAANFAPALTSPDPYMYFSFAKVGFGSFAPAPHAANIPDFPLSAWWCTAHPVLLPSAYGPGFITYARALVGNVHNAGIAIHIFRAANVVWLLLCLAILRKMKFSAATLVLFALNSAVLFQYIANAHNDIIPIALVLAAIGIASTPIGICAVVAAGLVKAPFLAVGALAFPYEPSVLRRFLASAVAVVLGFALSFWWAGPKYFAGLTWYRHLLSSTGDPLQLVLTGAVLLLLIAALVKRRYHGAGALTFQGLAVAEIQPWYVLWGLPYAALQRENLAAFLASLPLSAFLMDDGVPLVLQKALFFAIAITVVVFALRDLQYGERHKLKPAERASS